ncbi:hypothetical protein ACFL7E_05000 [Thermodesulfobacteriota bacterium]
MEAFLVKSIQLQDVKCFILTLRDCWANLYYRALRIQDFVFFDDYLSDTIPSTSDEIDAILSKIRSFSDLMAYETDGVQIGKYICSTLVRETYHGNVDISDPAVIKKIRASTRISLQNVEAAKRIYNDINPEMTLFLERGYTPYGEFFDLSLLKGLDTIQWCGSHRTDALTLKRYHIGNMANHPATISPKSWEMIISLNAGIDYATRVQEEFLQGYQSGDWYGEVGTQFNTEFYEQNDLKRKIGIDPDKKTAAIFSHLFWDATFFYGKDLFENYREWFVESIKVACENEDVNWLVKMHPANTVKLKRDGYEGDLVEIQAIRECVGELPDHVKLLYPDTDISTFSLFQLIDYCITVRGTIGIEAACFGKPVFTAGTGRYDHLGFTHDSETREEYLKKLRNIETFPGMDSKSVKLAQKYAFAAFIARPFELKSLIVEYSKDEQATMSVRMLHKNALDFYQQPDVKTFGDWVVNSQDEDFLDPAILREVAGH